MRFKYGIDIKTFDGEKVGELEHVVIDPQTNQVTSIVAKKGLLLPDDKVIPIGLVQESNEEHIKLFDFEGSFEDLDDYVEVYYIEAKPKEGTTIDQYDENVTPLLAYPPSGSVGMGFVPIIRNPDGMRTKVVKNTPAGTKNITEGTPVLGLEGEHVGDVEEVIIESQSDQVTHFVISKGIVFSEEKLIPASWVQGYDDDQLKLVVDETVIENLPDIDN